MHRALSLALLALLGLSSLQAQEQPDPLVTKLREGLRNTMLQLREVQGKAAVLEATNAQNDLKIKELTAQVAKLTKQSSDDKLVADKTISDLREQVAAQDTRNAKQVDAIGKWKKSYETLLSQAKAIEAKRAELASQKIQLDRRLADAQSKNRALYDLGKQILHRYERYGLGDALLAREPFVGISKVQFETYIQENGDKLADQKIKPVPSTQ